jgi:hypothetical protein
MVNKPRTMEFGDILQQLPLEERIYWCRRGEIRAITEPRNACGDFVAEMCLDKKNERPFV